MNHCLNFITDVIYMENDYLIISNILSFLNHLEFYTYYSSLLQIKHNFTTQYSGYSDNTKISTISFSKIPNIYHKLGCLKKILFKLRLKEYRPDIWFFCICAFSVSLNSMIRIVSVNNEI